LRAASAGVFPKRVLVLSPHPDDDVISMGGTLCRLVEHGHEVHIAYQVSGAPAVPDEALWRSLCFVRESGLVDDVTLRRVQEWCERYEREGMFPAGPEVRRWRALIRRHEAAAAARVCGVPLANLHFLELPFYEAATVRARRRGEADVQAMTTLLNELQPHLLYASGDLKDPHGTHRLCLHALREALARCNGAPWLEQAELWLYRGIWAEWRLDEIDMAVPLSPQELLRRRRAVFRHATQKDRPLFMSGDQREFWQTAEDRCRQLAEAYNALGLAEYEAIEAFKRYAPDEFLRHVQL
jgi:glucosamine-6-phosphate deaminase